MNVLLLRLAGPMQSWGMQSLYNQRDSGREPSKSGVIGLLCAALGRDRSEAVDDLAGLRMGVRVDREGILREDFHTAQTIGVDGEVKGNPEVTHRSYLADAIFLVALEGDASLLEQMQQALKHPRWMLCLGRKAFAPAEPVWLPDGLREDTTLEQTLASYPWLGKEKRFQPRPARLRVVLDDPMGEQVRPDVPVSFAGRHFSSRRVHTLYVPAPAETGKEAGCTSPN